MTRHEDRKAERMKDPEFHENYTRVREELKGITVGGVTYANVNDKDAVVTPKEKIAIEKADAILTAKVEERDPICWCYGCDRPAWTWVREVQFDIKGENVAADNAIVDTRDYGGPVPGFCWGHETVGCKQLAEAVYSMRPEFQWGAPAKRWFVIFTDGTKQGGQIVALDLPKGTWTVKEDYAPGDAH